MTSPASVDSASANAASVPNLAAATTSAAEFPRALEFELYSSAFCGPCAQTRATLGQAAKLIPGAVLTEYDVAANLERAEAEAVRMTPTVIIRAGDGAEVFRAEGAPRLQQVLVAAAKAL